MKTIKDIMTIQVLSLTPDQTLLDAEDMMRSHRVDIHLLLIMMKN